MAVDCDYYELLNISRTADEDTITAAIKKATREWRKRVEAPDLDRRQEAEVNVKRIQEARETLLNATRRQQYDARLVAEGVARLEPVAASSDWLQQARDYLSRGDYHSAAYAAREATQNGGNNAETWLVRSRANAGLGRLDDALYEAQQAVQLVQNNAEYHFHLGCVCEELSRWDRAINEFQTAAGLDSSVPMYQLAVGGVYLQNGLPDKALPIIEPVYRANPDDGNAAFYYGSALLDSAEDVPKVKDKDGYWVTSREEIAAMRDRVGRAKSIKNLPSELRAQAAQISAYLDRMEAKKFRPPIAAFAPTSCVGVLLFVAVVLSPIWLVVGGIAAMSDGAGAGFLMVLIGLGLGFLFFKLSYVPTWKTNARGLT